MNHTKVCTVCQEELPATIEYFHKSKKDKFGLRQCCILCRKKEYTKNKSYYSSKNKEYYQKNKAKILEQRIDYRKKNKKSIAYMQKRWRSKNKEKILQNNIHYTKQKRKTNINFKILCNIRSRIGNAIKRNKKRTKTIHLLGCSIEELKIYLESKFSKGMCWDNYGKNGWHMDHIIPCASFDLTDLEQQKKCFHYTNLQPLWAEDNLRKSDKIP